MEASHPAPPEEQQRHLHAVPDIQENQLALGQFTAVDKQTYSNGADHLYGVDQAGKKVHISHDSVLAAYGYEARPKEDTPESYELQSPMDGKYSEIEQRQSSNGVNKLYGRDSETGKLEQVSYDSVLDHYGKDTAGQGKNNLSELQADYVAAEQEGDEVGMRRAAKAIDAYHDRHNTVSAGSDEDEPDYDDINTYLNAAAEVESDISADSQIDVDAPVEVLSQEPDALQLPVTDTTPKGMKARLKSIWTNAKAELGIFMANRPADYFKSKMEGREQSEKRAIKVIAVAAGAVLTAGLVTVAYKQGNLDFIPGVGDGSAAAPGAGETGAQPGAGAAEAASAAPEASGEIVTVPVDPGEGTSHIARDVLGIDFSTKQEWDQFNAATNPLIANLDGTYWDSNSSQWRIADTGNFAMPQQVLDEMRRVADEMKAAA